MPNLTISLSSEIVSQVKRMAMMDSRPVSNFISLLIEREAENPTITVWKSPPQNPHKTPSNSFMNH